MGRSEKALTNVATGLMNKLIMIFLAFITRTMFIRALGAEYSGVSGLFTNILSVLSLAELGVGNVLMFYLYGALKNNDEEKIAYLVNDFKKVYVAIIGLILSIGIVLIPVMEFIVNSNIDFKELILYYCLYLINTIASYFVVYRIMVIKADQKEYIVNMVQTICIIIMYCLQMASIIFFESFLVYLVIQVCSTVAQNIILNYIAKKHYPYLNNRIKNNYDSVINKVFLKNIKATFLFKISDTVLDQTDSIIISVLFGTIFVGYYYNYYLLVTYMVSVASIIANGLLASFGNLNAEGNMEKSFKMFKVSLMGFFIIGTYCTACYACIVQEFIPFWIGKEYVMNNEWVIAILLVFYLRMVTNTMWMYRSSMGIFKEVQYINVIAAVINIVLSILLGKVFGVPGVIIATAIARITTTFWYEGKVVFEKFEKSVSFYYIRQIKDFLVCVIIVGISIITCNLICMEGVLNIILKFVVVTGIVLFSVILYLRKTEEYKLVKNKIINIINKKTVSRR